MSTIGIGLIGCGAMGRSLAVRVLQESNQVAVRAIYDPDPRSVKSTLKHLVPDAATENSVADLVARDDIEWVMIASWNSFHAAQTIAAFKAGKNVFCQKPLATNLDDCLAMRTAWKRSGKEFLIGFTLRYSPHYRRLKQLLSDGVVGEILSLEFNETLEFNHGGYIMGDWRRSSQYAGSHLLEKCCHDIDIVNWLVGSRVMRVASFGGLNFFIPENVHHIERLGKDDQGRAAYTQWGGLVNENPFTSQKDIVDNQVIIMEFENRVRASFHLNSNAGIPERRLYICGSEGTVRADVLTGSIEVKKIGFDAVVGNHDTGVSGMHGEGDQVLARELVATMVSKEEVAAGLEEGLAGALVCFAIEAAMQRGQVVHLDSDWQKLDAPELQSGRSSF